jgi:RNA polymerase sigma-70 factor (ECF subfamily)
MGDALHVLGQDPTVDDEALLAAWRAGDRDAGAQLFDRYFEGVSRFFRTKCAEDPDDLIGATFLECTQGRDRFTGTGTFRSYLFGIAYNLLREHFRRTAREAARFEPLTSTAAELAPRPSSKLIEHEDRRRLLEALRRIPLEHQTLLELYFWEPLTAAEIGVVLGIPEGTVRTRIRRAKELLERELTALLDTPLQRTATTLEDWALAAKP